MKQVSSPDMVEVAPGAALTDAVVERARSAPDEVVFTRRTGDQWLPVSAKEFATEVTALAAGLVATGVQAGDRVALMSRTRYEWTLCDYAIWTAGAVTVPIYETSSGEQVEWTLRDSGAVCALVETPVHADLVESVRGAVPGLRSVVTIDTGGNTGGNLGGATGGLDRLAAAGAGVPAAELTARRATLTADSLATLIYTSGTTGRPKGCELTHRNLISCGRTAGAILPEVFRAGGSTLLFLPLAHVFARLIQTACVETGARMGHTADVKNLVADLGTFSPTFLLSVPRVFEKIYNGSRQKAVAGGKGKIFDRADAVAVAYSQARDRGSVGVGLRLQHAVFDKLVYAKLRAALGGQVAHAVSGGAPLGARLGHFFRGAGVTVVEGYGLTETTASATINTPSRMRIGSVGRPAPGVTVGIADDGEILLRGPVVFRGYWHDEDATAQALTDGWLHTGDLGDVDADGFLTITGRKKEILVTAGGKNVAPAMLEDRLRAHPLVSQCMVVGDAKPYIACLITLDADAVGPWLSAHARPADAPVAGLVQDPQLLAELQSAVDEANKAVSRAEAIKRFAVLAVDWTEEGGQLTPTLKLRRSAVLEQCRDDVEALYR